MSPHQIKDPEFDSVHVVRKGASPGARILLLKSAEGNEQMQTTTTIMKAFRDGNFHEAMGDAITLRKRGEIGSIAYAELYGFAAETAYPLKKSWEAKELFRQTPLGSKMFTEGLAADHADMMRDTARTNAALVEKSKRPIAVPAENEGIDDDADGDPDEELKKLGEAYGSRIPWPNSRRKRPSRM
jgi:hypothetical protein